MPHPFDTALQNFLKQQNVNNLLRERQIFSSELDFASNDYLGLTQDPAVKQAYMVGFDKYPIGSSGSALISGYHTIHQQLELEFARVYKRDKAILFPSAYAANLAVMLLLKKISAPIVLDKSCHASIYDGSSLANINHLERFLHNDVASLATKLKSLNRPSIILTESIFSMSGQVANLAEILAIAKQYDAKIILDEAHAFGVVGDNGLGLGYKYSDYQIPILIIGFGKAMGAAGAVVVGQAAWLDALLQVARPYIYSTAISPAYTYGLLQSFKYIQKLDSRRSNLQENIKIFREMIQNSKFEYYPSNSPIQGIKLGCPKLAINLQQKLCNQGINCKAIRTPTVPTKDSGVRIVLRSNHTRNDILKLGAALG